MQRLWWLRRLRRLRRMMEEMDMEQLALSEAEKKQLEHTNARIREIFAEDLCSLIVFGSATRGTYLHGQSDLNLLLVLGIINPGTLAQLNQLLTASRAELRIAPYIIRQAELSKLTTHFPTRLWDMRRSYVVLYGSDVLAALTPDLAALRQRNDQELFNLVLRLRHAVTTTCSGEWVHTLSTFVPALTKCLRERMLSLTGEQIEERAELFKQVSARWGLDPRVFLQVTAWRAGELHLTDDEARLAMPLVLEALERVMSHD